jgi:hypothetical protein
MLESRYVEHFVRIKMLYCDDDCLVLNCVELCVLFRHNSGANEVKFLDARKLQTYPQYYLTSEDLTGCTFMLLVYCLRLLL